MLRRQVLGLLAGAPAALLAAPALAKAVFKTVLVSDPAATAPILELDPVSPERMAWIARRGAEAFVMLSEHWLYRMPIIPLAAMDLETRETFNMSHAIAHRPLDSALMGNDEYVSMQIMAAAALLGIRFASVCLGYAGTHTPLNSNFVRRPTGMVFADLPIVNRSSGVMQELARHGSSGVMQALAWYQGVAVRATMSFDVRILAYRLTLDTHFGIA